MKQIQLTRGREALVDDEDYERLSRRRWRFSGLYAIRTVERRGRKTTVLMHREIMDAPKGIEVDHINGDGLDNRKCNLRLVTRGQNAQNQRRARKGCASGLRGVCLDKRTGRWHVRLVVNGVSFSFGSYADKEEAGRVAKEARRRHMTHCPERRPTGGVA